MSSGSRSTEREIWGAEKKEEKKKKKELSGFPTVERL